jgi:hypothetical protein
MGEMGYAYKSLTGKFRRRRLLERPRRKTGDSIKLFSKEKGVNIWTGFKCLRIGGHWPTLVNTVINVLVP